MRKLISTLLFSALLSAPAFADWTGKDALSATNTFKNASGACTSVVCVPQTALTDSTGVNFVAVPTAGADAQANATTGLLTYSRNVLWNGTTWDRWTGDLTNGGWVNVKTSVLPTGAASAANQTNGTQTTGLVAGSAIVGKVGIDQTTPGTTNGAGAAQATVSAGNTLNAVVANSTGTSIAVTGYGAALFNVNCSVNCSGGTTVNFQASDVVGFQTVGAMPVAGATGMVTSVLNQSGAALFCVPNFGYTNMRATVTGYSAGTISVTITPINVASCDVAQVANALAAVANNADGVAASGSAGSPTVNYNYGFNGSSWDRQYTIGNQIAVQIAQTVTASSAYASGNAVGGLMTVTNAARVSGSLGASGTGGMLQNVAVNSKSVQTAQMDIFVFNANPSGSTCTDKTAFVLATADFDKVVGVISVPSTVTNNNGWFSGGTGSVGQANNQAMAYDLSSATSLFACMVTRGTPTFTATTDISVKYNFLRN